MTAIRLPAKFGWCLTGYHDTCRASIDGHECSCECHRETPP